MITTKYEDVKIPIRLGYIEACWYGKRNERPILALHGWQDNAGSYALLAPLLSQHIPILAIDFPGHGRSSHLPAGIIYNIIYYVRMIKEIMLYFKWSKISIICHSMGAAVTYYFTALFPESVDMIISIDVLHTRLISSDLQIRNLRSSIEKFIIDTERKIVRSKNSEEPKLYTIEEMEQLSHLGSERSIDLNKAKYILKRNIKTSREYSNKYYFSRDDGIKIIRTMTNTEPGITETMAKRMHNIKWLTLKAEDSYYIDVEQPITKKVLTILKENNPDFSYQVVSGVKHHLHLNNAEKVAEYIIPFLQKHKSAERIEYEGNAQLSKL